MLWKPRNFVALLIATMACWAERRAAAQLDYLKAENLALRSRLGGTRSVAETYTSAVHSFICASQVVNQH